MSLLSGPFLQSTADAQEHFNVQKIATNRDSVKSNSDQDHSLSPRGAMLRSILFPGWGQWYNGKRLKAVIFFCGEFGLLVNSIYLNQQYHASTEDYEREFYIENRNLSTWWLIGSLLYSMTDAYVDAHLSTFDESPELSFDYDPSRMSHSMRLSLTFQLN